MGDYTTMQTIGRGLYAAGGGDIAAYDKMKQDAELAKAKAAQDLINKQMEQQKWQFEQEQQLQQNGYNKLGIPLDQAQKRTDISTLSIPGGNSYFKLNNPEPKTFSEKLNKLKYEATMAMNPTDRNNALLGIKPVDDMSAYRLANTLAMAENGGSLMSGIGDNAEKYKQSRDAWYKKLKSGITAAGNTSLAPQTASDIDSTASNYGF